ncbi:MAG: tetraacyldisaccharide 4'-kinase [Flavitalea sp.]
MNFNEPLLKPFRILLFPFSIVYGAGVKIRNYFFDKKIFDTATFNMPVICIGNLSVGGTGKSPMVEFLLGKFHKRYKLAVLSRGYKRKTKGYALADDGTSALDIGDEPMIFYEKFPDVAIAVGEERIVAIPQLLHDRPDTQAIILDDAFQHRSVTAGLNIILSDYNNLFTRDWFLPTGDLRDQKSSYKRADFIVVTKCPADLPYHEAQDIRQEIDPLKNQSVFYTTINYGLPYHLIDHKKMDIDEDTEVLLVSGIANPRPLKKLLSEKAGTYYELSYADHHIFTIDDWKEILKKFHAIQAPKKIILTTEKDAVRLMKFSLSMTDVPVFAIPISVQFLFDGEENFLHRITEYIDQYQKNIHGKERPEEKKEERK